MNREPVKIMSIADPGEAVFFQSELEAEGIECQIIEDGSLFTSIPLNEFYVPHFQAEKARRIIKESKLLAIKESRGLNSLSETEDYLNEEEIKKQDRINELIESIPSATIFSFKYKIAFAIASFVIFLLIKYNVILNTDDLKKELILYGLFFAILTGILIFLKYFHGKNPLNDTDGKTDLRNQRENSEDRDRHAD